MAGDWIKMRADLHTHPKVVRMASALKADRLRIVGGLHSAWCLFDVHSVDGFLDGYSPETLDDMIGFPGFARSMMAVGWLEMDGENLVMPRFSEHNGQSAKRRAQDAARKRDVRKKSATEADNLRTREEKRREDIKDQTPHSAYEEKSAAPVDNFTAAQQAMITAPATGGKFAMFDDWQPDEDLQRRAAVWGIMLKTPPEKTEIAEFVTYWIGEGKFFTQSQWEQKLARSVSQRRIRPATAAPANRQRDITVMPEPDKEIPDGWRG